jgi:hypothetical protein
VYVVSEQLDALGDCFVPRRKCFQPLVNCHTWVAKSSIITYSAG